MVGVDVGVAAAVVVDRLDSRFDLNILTRWWWMLCGHRERGSP